MPQGFAVQEFASALEKPRIMLQAPGGEILVSEYIPNGRVSVLTDKDKDGKADAQRKFLIENLDRPYGLAFWKNYLYVAEATSLKRYKFDAKAVSVDTGEEIISLKDYGKGHVTRTIAFDSKGNSVSRHRFGNELRSRRSGEARRDLEVQAGRNGLPNFSRRVSAIPRRSTSIPERTRYGPRFRNATVSATTWSRISSRTSTKAASTDGPTRTSARMKTPATRASVPISSRRRLPPTFHSVHTLR